MAARIKGHTRFGHWLGRIPPPPRPFSGAASPWWNVVFLPSRPGQCEETHDS